MKTVLLIFLFYVCTNTFAQQLHVNTNKSTLYSPSFINSLNFKSDSLNTYGFNSNLKSPYFYFQNSATINYDDFSIDTKNINRKSNFSETSSIDLKKELRNIMFKYPGDGNNLYMDARGLDH